MSLATCIVFYNKNADYKAYAAGCGNVFSPLPSWLTSRIDRNKGTYIQVANETGVPWEMLAAVHYRETNNARLNPWNGQGIYQLYSTGSNYPYSPNEVSDSEFLSQTRTAANFIQGKASLSSTRTSLVTPRKLNSNENDLNLIKNTLFSYNGRASVYADQSQNLGFNRTSQPFEGSPYVMNMFDCKRSSMGLITKDNGPLDGTDTRLGAFTLYARLKSDDFWKSLIVENLPGCSEATNTNLVCVWRAENTSTGGQFLTTSYSERNTLVAMGYSYHNTAFFGINPVARNPGNIPVYQLKKSSGATFLTTSDNERNILRTAYGYQDDGIAFYADPSGSNSGYPVYRLYSSARDSHLWTASELERNNLVSSGLYASEGTAFTSISSVRQETAAKSGQQLIYRFSSMPGNSHFWTSDVNERDAMIRAGYRYEGVAWSASSDMTSSPVYRLYSSIMKKHLYTTDNNERRVLSETSSWKDEGVAYYSSPNSTSKPIYRLYSPITKNHLLTSDAYEKQVLTGNGTFRDEGVAYYAY